MSIKANVIKAFMGFLMLVFCTTASLSYADWSVGVSVGGDRHDHFDHPDHRFYGWHDHPHWGYHIHYLPTGYYTIWVGGARYYYYDGLYYSYVGDGDFVIVDPPVGAYVRAIPPDFQPIIVNGRTYYTSGGIYYVFTPHGYKVVPGPVVYAPPVTMVVTQAPPPVVNTQDSFPVNIPNSNGSYTTIVVKRSGNGYVGPQGEFYANFPSVAQLKAMYAK